MAITQTKTIQRIEVYPGATAAEQPKIMVVEQHNFDDPDDAELPVVTTKVKHLYAYQDDGVTATDVTRELQLVQDVADGIWSYS